MKVKKAFEIKVKASLNKKLGFKEKNNIKKNENFIKQLKEELKSVKDKKRCKFNRTVATNAYLEEEEQEDGDEMFDETDEEASVSEGENDSDVSGGDDDGSEGEQGEEGVDHKKALDKLKKTDPEFYKFLEDNDKSLLEFNIDDDDDDNTDGDDDEKIHVTPQPGELEVNSDEDDFDDEKVVSQRSDKQVTLKMIKTWRDQLTSDGSVGTISTVVNGFHAALLSITGSINDDSSDMTSEYKVEGSAVFNGVVQLCVLELQPALVRFLKLPTESSALTKSQPAKCKRWRKVKTILKLYFTDLLKLLSGVTSENVLGVILKHIHQMSPFISYYQRTVKLLLKRLVNFWSESADETVRLLAFLCILRITTSQQKIWLEPAMKMMYMSYISNSKFVSPSTLPGINFMRRSLTEILTLDQNASYQHAFLYIRQLAILLRNGIVLHKKESIQSVYNWQYVCSLHLWADLLCATKDKTQLQMLLYPLVQVIIGCIKLIPTAQYYPLRFHCCQMLINLSRGTGVYIPVLPFLLEVLTITDFDKGHKKLSMKPMDLTCILRLSKSMMQENAFKEAVIENVYKLLIDSLTVESHRLSFPDLSLLVILQLKMFLKKCKVNKYVQKLKGAMSKIEENSKFIENERKRLSLNLSDKKEIESLERQIQAKGTPLYTFYSQLKKVIEQQEAKRITDNEKLGEFKLPVLKKGEKLRKRDDEEPEVKIPISDGDSDDGDELDLLNMNRTKSSDDDDDDDADEEEEITQIKKKKKKVKKIKGENEMKKKKISRSIENISSSRNIERSKTIKDKDTDNSGDISDLRDVEDELVDFKLSDSE